VAKKDEIVANETFNFISASTTLGPYDRTNSGPVRLKERGQESLIVYVNLGLRLSRKLQRRRANSITYTM
jgi:hypothetical protein